MLGKEAALHASSQPFLVPLIRNGHRVPGAVAPDGVYAPVTPAYSNPLARFIPNVTYYPIGNIPPSNGVVQKPRTYNAFDEDNSTIGFLAPPFGGRASLAQDKKTRYTFLSKLYSALAEQEDVMKRDSDEELKIQSAIQRLAKGSSSPKALAPAEQDFSTSRGASQQLTRIGLPRLDYLPKTAPDFSSDASAPDRWEGGEDEGPAISGAEDEGYAAVPGSGKFAGSLQQVYSDAEEPVLTISPRGQYDAGDVEMPQYA